MTEKKTVYVKSLSGDLINLEVEYNHDIRDFYTIRDMLINIDREAYQRSTIFLLNEEQRLYGMLVHNEPTFLGFRILPFEYDRHPTSRIYSHVSYIEYSFKIADTFVIVFSEITRNKFYCIGVSGDSEQTRNLVSNNITRISAWNQNLRQAFEEVFHITDNEYEYIQNSISETEINYVNNYQLQFENIFENFQDEDNRENEDENEGENLEEII